MVSFFKDKSAVSVFWLIIVCCGLHAYSLINAPHLNVSANEGFFYYLLSPFSSLQPYTLSVIYVLLIFLIALQLNFVVNDLNLLTRQSYTVALAFVLLSALLPVFNQVTAALLSCNFIIWIFYGVCRLYNSPNAKSSIYNIGLITGVSIILYYVMMPMAVIVLLSFLIIRPFRANEFFILLFGIITPFYFLLSILFLNGNLKLLPLPQQLFNIYFTAKPQFSFTILTIIIAAAVTVWAMFIVRHSEKRELIQVRKSWTLAAVFLLFFIPAIFFVKMAYPSAILIAMIPAACYIGYAFGSTSRSIIPTIIFWLFVGLSIYNNWFGKY
ncbi:MAG TPA: DUF6427 family protein [Parafilimonas sp.]|nr:DUF6427 family protein [Parafilimonas sp.]